jgi:hypothetical protein
MLRYILHAIAFCVNFLASAALWTLFVFEGQGDASMMSKAFLTLWFALNLGLAADLLTWDGGDE